MLRESKRDGSVGGCFSSGSLPKLIRSCEPWKIELFSISFISVACSMVSNSTKPTFFVLRMLQRLTGYFVPNSAASSDSVVFGGKFPMYRTLHACCGASNSSGVFPHPSLTGRPRTVGRAWCAAMAPPRRAKITKQQFFPLTNLRKVECDAFLKVGKGFNTRWDGD